MGATDVPPNSIPPPAREHRDVAHEREVIREELFGGARLLVADTSAVSLLLNQARIRLIVRLFGISGPGSGLVTIIALGLAAETAHRKLARALAIPRAPHLGEAALGASALTESARWIAGPGIGDFPLFGPLLLFAVAGHLMRPALRSTVHGVRGFAHQAHADLDHRYGHIVRRNRARPEPPS
jgi:hypothetical protein